MPATGPKGNVTKGDVVAAVAATTAPAPAAARSTPAPAQTGREERVKMTRLRKRIAERLMEAQKHGRHADDLQRGRHDGVMALRARYQDSSPEKHGIKLGFMAFFVKAAVEGLKAYPAVNAEIDGDEIVYKHHFDIGVAVSTDQGLVVPVIRDADALSFAEIEKTIADFGKRARDGKLAIEELTRRHVHHHQRRRVRLACFSTPILNPPQSGILGMHAIQQRAVVMRDGQIVIRPMMYLALSYDHRIIDGREAVSFLVRVKECIESPERILLDA